MKWDLTYLYKTKEEYDKDFERLLSFSEGKLASFKGKLGNEDCFVEYLKLSDEFEKLIYKLYQYNSLRADQNRKIIENVAELNKVFMVMDKVTTATSFEKPEFLSLGKEYIYSVLDKHPEISFHRFDFEKLFHGAEHILDEKSETIISTYSKLSRSGTDLYTNLTNGDRNSVSVTLKDGSKIDVSVSNWTTLIERADNEYDRKVIFEACFKYFEEHKNTLASIYENIMDANLAASKVRGFSSVLESYLFNNNIPTSVYYNLVDVASNNTESLKKYIKLRQKHLGLEEYHTYDRFIPLAKTDDEYTYDRAKEIYFASISHLPQKFQDFAKETLRDGFVDVYPSEGKRTGAYSSGVIDLHPFILLNYNNSIEDVFTLAHESGHSIHTLFAEENQPGHLQDYTIFVAEIASTFNEHMLLDYFMKSKDTSKETKIVLLQKAIDSIMATFYRQTLFAEYELKAHNLVENGQPINYEVLNNIMIELYQKYYGLDITKEIYKSYVWAYIPHMFHTPFYVYQYATSFSASFKLFKNVKDGGEQEFNRYIGLLKSGGSKYPMEQAKEAGVDFNDKNTFMAVVERMDYLVNELEALLNSK